MSSNLPRITQKIFAENAGDNIGQFGSALSGTANRTGDIEAIQALPAWGQGWAGAVISERDYPPLEEMTGVQKVFSQQIAYILQKGMPEWDNGTTYFQNDMCRVGSMFYYSKTDNNTGNNPDTDKTNWGRWNPAEGTYANIDLSNLSSSGQAILDSKLNHTQVTNCILANNGAEITKQSYEGAAYVNNGCTVSEAEVVSGFGANNFILLNKTMTDSNTFVMTIPFKVNSTGGVQPLAAINNQDNCIQLDGGVLSLKYNGLELKGTVTVSTATQYYAILTRTETGYTLELKNSLEEESEVLDTINLTSTAGYFGGKSIYLGVDKSGNFLKGEINLAQLTITSGAEAYWNNTATSDFETVTLSGSLQVLMPNGRNADQTLKNVEQTITLNDVLLFNNSTDSSKTVLVKQDGEVMIRDFYAESDNAPEIPLNGIWFDTDNNIMYTQLNTYPNFINSGVIVENGVVSGFSEEDYLQLPEQYNLGGNWDITLAVTPASTTPTEPTQSTDATTPTDATSDTTPTEPTEATPCGLIGNIEVSGENYIPDGVGLIYDGAGSVTAVFRRADVYNVRKTVVLSTAYEVQKGTGETAEYGYVQTAGDEGSYVAADTQVYADSRFSTPLETAATDTWQYTGETQENTQTLDGYTKTAGSTLVPGETVIYSDANCTSVQGTASGTDYVYTGATSVSIIGTLTDTVTAGQENSVLLSYDGANYKLNQKTLASTDNIRNTITIPLGKALSTDGYFTGTINLNNSKFSFWTWNGVGEAIADLVPFVGGKIGSISIEQRTIVPNIEIKGTLANNNGIFSGFSNENMIIIPKTFSPGTEPWEMVFKVTTGTSFTKRQRIACSWNQDGGAACFFLSFGHGSEHFNNLWLDMRLTSEDTGASKLGTFEFQPGTTYWIKASFTGTRYIVAYSLSGEPDSYTNDIEISSTETLYVQDTGLVLGHTENLNNYQTEFFLGSIDLNKSYININGEPWWKWNALTQPTSTYIIGAAVIDKPLNLTFKQMVLDAIQNANPIGRPIFCLNGETLGNNEIWLEGATVSRTTYAELFAFYGTTYGEGDGSTTFELPDFRNRTLWGSDTFGYIEAGLPNITGWFRLCGTEKIAITSGAFVAGSVNEGMYGQGHENGLNPRVDFDASRANPIYGNTDTVQPPAIQVRVKTRYK